MRVVEGLAEGHSTDKSAVYINRTAAHALSNTACLFNQIAVKENLQSYYFERVRCGFADKKESLLAVMFLLEKQPEDITIALYENALTYLRRDQGVSAFGSRLHGKKQ